MSLRKLFLFLVATLALLTGVSAQDIFVDALEDQPRNRSYEENEINFQTEYMNQTVPWKNATYPDELHQYLSKCQISSKDKDSSNIEVNFESSFGQEKTVFLLTWQGGR